MSFQIIGNLTLSDINEKFASENQCLDYLESIRWQEDIISPFDNLSKIYRCQNHNFRCRNTGKYFNVKTYTLFHNTKIELKKWFLAIWYMSNDSDITAKMLAQRIGVSHKTAWLMQKRILKTLELEKSPKSDQMALTDWLTRLN